MRAAYLGKDHSMEPVFAPPPGIVATIPSQDAFIAFLERHNVQLSTWHNPDEQLREKWGEIEKHDAVYLSRVVHETLVPIRFIVTVAARVRTTLTHGSKVEHMVLTELVRGGSHWRARKYSDTSMSEKMKLDGKGIPTETCAETLVRCLEEEVRLNVPLETVIRGLTFMPWPDRQPVDDPVQLPDAQYVEVHVHEKRRKTPGLLHCNQIARYLSHLPEDYYFIGLREDAATRYRSHWSSVHESMAQFDPIPENLIL